MRLQTIAKKASFRIFSTLDAMGLHVLPKHYYTPIPNYTWLQQNKPLWVGRIGLVGIPWDLDAQLGWLTEICQPFYGEIEGLEFYNTAILREWGPGYGPIESQVLHCVMRSSAPRKVIEIGSGVSTACILHASTMNAAEGRGSTEMICIEPFPRPAFKRLIGAQKSARHIREQCQTVPLSVFDDLQAGDMLFIDSSHAVKTGSDVVRIYMDILPRLNPGVLVHVHDIYLPYSYPRDVMSSYFGWQETTLMAALLTGNRRFSVSTCLSALHYDRKAELRQVLHDYRPQHDAEGLQADTAGHFPSSIWLMSQTG